VQTDVEITGTAQASAWEAAVMPPVEVVRPGLWSIPVPIPNNPLRYVLVYAIELRDGVAIIDAGWSTHEAWSALCDGLRVAGFSIRDVRAALITHIHPDHYGLAGRVREESGAWVALHPADAALLPARYGMDVDTLLDGMRTLLRECGVPEDVVAELSAASMGIRDFVRLAEPDVLLQDGQRLDLPGCDMVALHTPGHSPGHVCFHDRQRSLLLSGDHVLPRISPNITVHAQQSGNPLADFLAALTRIRALDVHEVLPAHEWRFRPLDRRVEQLLAHHRDRADETQAAVESQPGITCWQATLQLRWSREWQQITGFMRRAAVGETLAHLVYLESLGRVVQQGSSPARWWPAESAQPSDRP
jgi:glyoxylase-like metal-dependent hydrolase (beta-lactamase superfamily II)